MSPVRVSLAFVSLLAILLIGAVVFSPSSSLLAQGASPTATSTNIPYNELPWCDITTPDLLTPTAIVPSQGDSNNATCRVHIVDSVVIQPGEDTSNIGAGGDPRNVTPGPGTPSPFDTPAPESTDVSQASADSSNQTNKLYLPLAQSNGSSPSDAVRSDTSSSESDLPYPGYIPYDQLPWCPESTTPIDPSKGLPPDPNAAPTCRVHVTMAADVTALLKQGVDLNTVGIGGDPLNNGIGLPTDGPLAGLKTSSLTLPNANTNFSWAQTDLTIPGTPYITYLWSDVSNLDASLASGKSWNAFHYYNRIALGSTTNNCGQQDKFTIGVVKGHFGSNTFTTPTVVYEEYDNHVCGAFPSSQTVSGPVPVRIRRIAANTWQGEFWTGSTWYVIFSSTVINWGQDGGLRAAAGHEYWTSAGDKASMKIPTNFASHNFINTVPWHDSVLPSSWVGHSIYVPDAPFGLLDAVGGDYTSLSVKAN